MEINIETIRKAAEISNRMQQELITKSVFLDKEIPWWAYKINN